MFCNLCLARPLVHALDEKRQSSNNLYLLIDPLDALLQSLPVTNLGF
jgi:hypothetical protein